VPQLGPYGRRLARAGENAIPRPLPAASRARCNTPRDPLVIVNSGFVHELFDGVKAWLSKRCFEVRWTRKAQRDAFAHSSRGGKRVDKLSRRHCRC